MSKFRKPLSYRQTVQVLLGLVNYEVKPPPMQFDTQGWHLEAFAGLLERLGNPAAEIPTIHIAGTKGKGSTTRLTAALLRAAGLRRIGIFTSPHINSFRERIAIDFKPISKADFVQAFAAVRNVQGGQESQGFRTTFETLTAMALYYFEQQGCNVVILETGLGGRLDATNVPPSQIAVITAIGYDHQRVLGHRLRDIAGEKTGIIKSGVKHAVIAPQPRNRMNIVQKAAFKQACKHKTTLQVFSRRQDALSNVRPDDKGFLIDLKGRGGDTLRDLRFPFLGEHQIDNLRAALMATEAYQTLHCLPSLKKTSLDNVFKQLQLPGKLQVLSDTPHVIIDSAHCPVSTLATANAVNQHFNKPSVVLLLGILNDKNLQAIVRNLTQHLKLAHIFVYAPPTPRALPIHKVIDALHKARGTGNFIGSAESPVAEACASPEEAAWQGLKLLKSRRADLLLATGSTYGIAPLARAFGSSMTLVD